MENEIIDNIYHLYRSHIVTLILYILLCCAAVLIVIGVIKFKLIKSKVCRVLLLIVACVCAVLLPTIQIVQSAPVRADYRESSYILLEHATMTVTSASSGGLDRINDVVVTDREGNHYDLKLPTDYKLDYGNSYTGTIAYLKHSGFVVWYEIEP